MWPERRRGRWTTFRIAHLSAMADGGASMKNRKKKKKKKIQTMQETKIKNVLTRVRE